LIAWCKFIILKSKHHFYYAYDDVNITIHK